MGRSGYDDCCDDAWGLIRWRGAVASAIRGRRGQAFLRELIAALDALSVHELITNDLIQDGSVCALGAVGLARGLDMAGVDPYERDRVANLFGIAEALAAEIMCENDEVPWRVESPAKRWERMRAWAVSHIAGAAHGREHDG